MIPINTEVITEKPNKNPIKTPTAKGISPFISVMIIVRFGICRNWLKRVSRPAINMRKTRPISEKKETTVLSIKKSLKGPRESKTPAKTSATTQGTWSLEKNSEKNNPAHRTMKNGKNCIILIF